MDLNYYYLLFLFVLNAGVEVNAVALGEGDDSLLESIGASGEEACLRVARLHLARIVHRVHINNLHIVELLKDTWDITISEGTVDNILTRSAERAEAALNKIENEQLNADVLFTDATTTSVNGKQTYIRNTSTADDVLYHYMSSKSIASIKNNTPLKHFAGTLVHDHETALYHFGTEHAECNVHVLRYLKKCTEEARNTWSKDMAKLLSDINTERNACIQDGIRAFPEDKIRSVSDRYSEILCQGYEQNKKTKYQYSKKDELALLNRLSKNKQNHLLFVSDFSIPFDNNASERDLRKVKSHTKMRGGFRTEAGIKG